MPMLGLTAKTLGLKYKTPSSKDGAALWHKLIPGSAISLQVLLESFLSFSYGGETCSGPTEAFLRTLACLLAWATGLANMRWEFAGREAGLSPREVRRRRAKHALVNVGVVTCWVFAVSDFPLKCWIGEVRVSEVRGFLVVLVQAFASLEVFEVDMVDGEEEGGEGGEEGVVSESTGLVA